LSKLLSGSKDITNICRLLSVSTESYHKTNITWWSRTAANPTTAGYVTSKHAVLGLTKSAALDCAPHRIHVNALCPGFVATALISGLFTPEAAAFKEDLEARHPFKGLGTPQDVARAAVFLASEGAAWVTGIALPVDGGYSIL
jgi:NAD(P)-dependent dehydrogenase (short-subunit alcohol dehydrogenase family)